MHKAIRSKFSKIQRSAEINNTCNLDFDKILPDDLTDHFYDSFLNQLQFFVGLKIFTVQDICHLLRISSKTFEKIKKGESDLNNYPTLGGLPPLITKEEEEILLNQVQNQQLSGNCFTPKEVH